MIVLNCQKRLNTWIVNSCFGTFSSVFTSSENVAQWLISQQCSSIELHALPQACWHFMTNAKHNKTFLILQNLSQQNLYLCNPWYYIHNFVLGEEFCKFINRFLLFNWWLFDIIIKIYSLNKIKLKVYFVQTIGDMNDILNDKVLLVFATFC